MTDMSVAQSQDELTALSDSGLASLADELYRQLEQARREAFTRMRERGTKSLGDQHVRLELHENEEREHTRDSWVGIHRQHREEIP